MPSSAVFLVRRPAPVASFEPRADHPHPADRLRSLPRPQSLRRAWLAALLALGRRMYAEGIDDGLTGTLIREADERLRSDSGALATLKAEREELFRRLAEAALEEDAPMPGADAEYVAAREVLRLQAGLEVALLVSRD